MIDPCHWYDITRLYIFEIRNIKSSFTNFENDGNSLIIYKAYLDESDFNYVVTRKFDINDGR